MTFETIHIPIFSAVACLLPLLALTFFLQLRKLPPQNVLAASAIILFVALVNIVPLNGAHGKWREQGLWKQALLEASFAWIPVILNARLVARKLAALFFQQGGRGLVVVSIAASLSVFLIILAKMVFAQNLRPDWQSQDGFSPQIAVVFAVFYIEQMLLQILITPWLISKKPGMER